MPLLAAPAATALIVQVGAVMWTIVGTSILADRTIGFTMKRRAAHKAKKSANPGLAAA